MIMARKLASIQRLEKLEEIPGADFIYKATVMGWTSVVRKDDFPKEKEGCKVVFVELDAILPDGKLWAEFMRPRKFRVKTCKLRGVLSQGLILSANILFDCLESNYDKPYEEISIDGSDFPVGTDVSALLNIKKYEIPEHHGGAKMGCAAGTFPRGVPKTDETRVQSALGVLEEIKKAPFYISVKCDGTSGTFVYDDEGFAACSRNFKKKEDDTNVYWHVARKYHLPEILKANPFIAIQGEICGIGIQKNKLMLPEPDFFIFNVYDVKKGRLYNFNQFIGFCTMYKLKTVPIESVIRDPGNFDHSLEAWLERAKGTYKNTNNRREGIVIRPLEPVYSETLRGRLSFKVINNEFLLKDED
jgi:RNA ligase (TIGR02306 family)